MVCQTTSDPVKQIPNPYYLAPVLAPQFHTIVILTHCNKSVICIIVFHKMHKHFMSIHVPDIPLSRTYPPCTIDGSAYS